MQLQILGHKNILALWFTIFLAFKSALQLQETSSCYPDTVSFFATVVFHFSGIRQRVYTCDKLSHSNVANVQWTDTTDVIFVPIRNLYIRLYKNVTFPLMCKSMYIHAHLSLYTYSHTATVLFATLLTLQKHLDWEVQLL